MLHRLLISTAVVGSMATAASAATVSYSSTMPAASTDFTNSTVGGIQQFDTSLGTLNSVFIELTGIVSGEAFFENLSNSGAAVTLTLNAAVALSTTNLGDIIVTLPTITSVENAAAFDGSIDFDGPSGERLTSLVANDIKTTTLTGASMAEFIGSGLVALSAAGTGLSNASGPGNLISGFNTFAGGTVVVTYDYTAAPPPPPAAVPLPAGMPLLLVGLGAMGLAAKRRKG